MIDFHTHILPGVDDGSRDVQMSLEMLRSESSMGVNDVVLTPHFYATENSPAMFLEKRQRAWERLAPNLTPDLPKLHLGAEVQYFEGITSVEDVRNLRIEGTDILLVEMPFCKWPDRVIADIMELNEWENTRVLLAHIERYMAMQPKDVWPRLRERGILMQSNVSFFDSWKTRHKAMKMLSRGEIQFLGTDCHSMGTRRPNWDRLPEKAKSIVVDNPYFDGFEERR